MRHLLSAVLLVVVSAVPSLALDSAIKRQLNALAPEERLEQRCDIEAMERIAAEQKGMRPDKVIAYTFGEPQVTENSIKAAGAVFRSSGEWYKLKYKCRTSEQNLAIQSFDYRVGEKVPESQWGQYYLYN